jgi:hypothetical protein
LAVTLAIGLAPLVKAQEQNAQRPSLSDLMTLTQLRHFKLWYAQRVSNWELAAYELNQFRDTIERTIKLYPTASSISQTNLIREKTEPAMADLERAISDRSGTRFETAYVQITNGCNQCHEAAGVGFIEVQVPTHSRFSKQNFSPSP